MPKFQYQCPSQRTLNVVFKMDEVRLDTSDTLMSNVCRQVCYICICYIFIFEVSVCPWWCAIYSSNQSNIQRAAQGKVSVSTRVSANPWFASEGRQLPRVFWPKARPYAGLTRTRCPEAKGPADFKHLWNLVNDKVVFLPAWCSSRPPLIDRTLLSCCWGLVWPFTCRPVVGVGFGSQQQQPALFLSLSATPEGTQWRKAQQSPKKWTRENLW